MTKKYIACTDRFCGATDCPNCSPEHFRGGIQIDDLPENNNDDNVFEYFED